MNDSNKLVAGSVFPSLQASLADGSTIDLGTAHGGASWHMLVVYRGRHCPMCTRYLNQLDEHREALANIGISVTAVSADTSERLAEHSQELQVGFPIAHGLSEEQMKQLGLYISRPRKGLECDYNFAEPGLFVINEQGRLQAVDISNAPFLRPEPGVLLAGLTFIRDPQNNYPIRGTVAY